MLLSLIFCCFLTFFAIFITLIYEKMRKFDHFFIVLELFSNPSEVCIHFLLTVKS